MTGSQTEINIHTTAGKIEDHQRRVDEAVHAGSERAVEKQHARGKKTARERLDVRTGAVRWSGRCECIR